MQYLTKMEDIKNKRRDNITGNTIGILITLIFAITVLLVCLGFVDVKDPATMGIVTMIISTTGSFVTNGVIYKYFNKNVGSEKTREKEKE